MLLPIYNIGSFRSPQRLVVVPLPNPEPIIRGRNYQGIVMQSETLIVTSLDNHKIFVRKWTADAIQPPPRAIIHILHGMAEHGTRYEPIAEQLVNQGYVVFAHDHRGHGWSVPQGGLLGHYADDNGWQLVQADVLKVNETIRAQYPDTPVVILGHSMGSFITLDYLIRHGRTVSGAILSGSALGTAMSLRSARMLTQLEKLRLGPKGRSKLIDRVTFANYNRQVSKHPRTDCDWLSRDEKQVDLYIEDPLCGFLCTNQLWLDLIGGLESIAKVANIRKIPADLPFYLLSGEQDPLSYDANLHGVQRLASHLRDGGLRNVSVKLYPGGRHEIFNEINRQQVVDELLGWLELQIPAHGDQTATG